MLAPQVGPGERPAQVRQSALDLIGRVVGAVALKKSQGDARSRIVQSLQAREVAVEMSPRVLHRRQDQDGRVDAHGVASLPCLAISLPPPRL